jgi:hypothetical protein
MGAIGPVGDGRLAILQRPSPNDINFNSKLGYLTPDTYNNRRCSKSQVVQITGWLDRNTDFVVTGTYNVGRLNQADCEALYLAATIYGPTTQAGSTRPIPQMERVDGGHFSSHVDSLGLTQTWCAPPKIVFGGSTWRQDDWDWFSPGETYTIAASYRTTVGSSITTHSMSMYTRSPKCGKAGQACCTANENYLESATPSTDPSQWKPWCEENAKCDDGLCNACGQLGQEPCATTDSIDVCNAENLTPLNGTCVACGGNGQHCCHNMFYSNKTCAMTKDPICTSSDMCTSRPASTGTPPPPPTITGIKCNGQPATTATTAHMILVQDTAGCGGWVTPNADSDLEAAACAHAQGYTVLTGTQMLQSYDFCVCSDGGVSTESRAAYSDGASISCIENWNGGASQIWRGQCTQAESDCCQANGGLSCP